MGDISRMVCYHFINILGHTNITSNININFSNICINYWRLILTDTLLKGGGEDNRDTLQREEYSILTVRMIRVQKEGTL